MSLPSRTNVEYLEFSNAAAAWRGVGEVHRNEMISEQNPRACGHMEGILRDVFFLFLHINNLFEPHFLPSSAWPQQQIERTTRYHASRTSNADPARNAEPLQNLVFDPIRSEHFCLPGLAADPKGFEVGPGFWNPAERPGRF
jgi:hypothetical protein